MANKPTNPKPLFFVKMNLEGWGEVIQPCHANNGAEAIAHCRKVNRGIISAKLVHCPEKWEAHYKHYPKGEFNSPLGD